MFKSSLSGWILSPRDCLFADESNSFLSVFFLVFPSFSFSLSLNLCSLFSSFLLFSPPFYRLLSRFVFPTFSLLLLSLPLTSCLSPFSFRLCLSFLFLFLSFVFSFSSLFYLVFSVLFSSLPLLSFSLPSPYEDR